MADADAAQVDENDDQSMEEILQSIKRIIAEEDEEGVDANDADQAKAAEEAEPGTDADANDSVMGSDVLELTDVVREDGTITSVDKADNPEPEAADEAPVDESTEASVEAPAVEEAEMPAEDADFIPGVDNTPPAADPIAEIMSQETASATAAALSSLKQSQPEPAPEPKLDSPSFRSGVTVEDLVLEALRPMLKEWLDANLPELVERLVRKEIERITR